MMTLNALITQINRSNPLPDVYALAPNDWEMVHAELKSRLEREKMIVVSAPIGEPNFLLRGVPVVIR